MTMSNDKVADAIRTVVAKLQKAIDEGEASRDMDAEEIGNFLLAIADEIERE